MDAGPEPTDPYWPPAAEVATPGDRPKMGGALAVLAAVRSVLGPLYALVAASGFLWEAGHSRALHGLARQGLPVPEPARGAGLLYTAVVVELAWGGFTWWSGWRLRQGRRGGAKWTKVGLALAPVLMLAEAFLGGGEGLTADLSWQAVLREVLPFLALVTAWSAAWLLYLHRSERVKALFPEG